MLEKRPVDTMQRGTRLGGSPIRVDCGAWTLACSDKRPSVSPTDAAEAPARPTEAEDSGGDD